MRRVAQKVKSGQVVVFEWRNPFVEFFYIFSRIAGLGKYLGIKIFIEIIG